MFGSSPIKSIESLNKKITKLVGSFVHPIYFRRNLDESIHIPVDETHQPRSVSSPDNIHIIDDHDNQPEFGIGAITQLGRMWLPQKIYSEQEMLRDLFLWSVFMDLPQMAKVLLTHLRPRICAALIASAIFKHYAKRSTNIDLKQKMEGQAYDFELYAARCVDQCYNYNEATSCELLLRQIPLFGKVTCMQVSEIIFY
jgi:hypothetical protein